MDRVEKLKIRAEKIKEVTNRVMQKEGRELINISRIEKKLRKVKEIRNG